MVDNFEQLRQTPPNMVIAQSRYDLKFTQNRFKVQELKKNFKYVMSLGVYNQLKFDPYKKKKALVPATMKFSKIYKPYIGQNLTNKTLLVWRTGGIGDLLFIQPSLRYLKELYPSCYIKFACGPQYQALVDNWDCIDELLTLPFNVNHLIESDYHATFEGVIERCKDAHKTCSYVLFSKWLGLDIPSEKLHPIIKPKKDKVDEVKKILSNYCIPHKDFITVQIRASSPIRTPSVDFWKESINYLTCAGYRVIITDSPRMSEWIDGFIKTLKNQQLCFNFSKHSTTLDYSIALISLSKLVIGTDSSMLHIAGALDVPLYGIYGPFLGEIRLSTIKRAKWVNAQSKCAPCFIHSHKPCPNSTKNGDSSCFLNIDIPKVMGEAIQFLKDCDK
jgi:ADP-heptose:LPS heptosyltransferase